MLTRRKSRAEFGVVISPLPSRRPRPVAPWQVPGEYLNHTADGVRTIQTRSWPPDDFNALDLIGIKILKRSAAKRGRAHFDPIDQHENMIRLRSPKKDRTGLSQPASVADSQSRYGPQDVRYS